MSEEIKINNGHEHKCLCQSKFLKKFLVTALGTFVGVYCALCLFHAIHKPPIIFHETFGGMYPMPQTCPCMMMHRHLKYEGDRKLEKQMLNDNRSHAPFEVRRNNIND